MITLSQAWYWAAAAIILVAAVPVILFDVLVASDATSALGHLTTSLP
jgi:hypothetical protein